MKRLVEQAKAPALGWLIAAADEIERLRDKVQDLRMHAQQDACEIERLCQQIATLLEQRNHAQHTSHMWEQHARNHTDL